MGDQGVQPYSKELIHLDDYLQDEGFSAFQKTVDYGPPAQSPLECLLNTHAWALPEILFTEPSGRG